jgi:hypothetical protein
MSKLPAIQFYPGDWRKDVGVQSLNYHDRGVWFEMLLLMHDGEVRGKLMLGGKAMTDEILASVLRIRIEVLTVTIQTLIDRGVTERDKRTGALINRRMIRDEELRAENRGKVAGWRKAKKLKNNCNQDVTIPVTDVLPLSSSSSSSSSSKARTTTPQAVFELPAWIDPETWSTYLEVRASRRAAKTPRAWKAVVKQLDAFRLSGHDPNAILETSIRSSWTDVYPPKSAPGGNTNGNGKPNRYTEIRDSTVDALTLLGHVPAGPDSAGGVAQTGASTHPAGPGADDPTMAPHAV